jgi:transposase
MRASNKRYGRFCGIDVAKDKHVACILDRDGCVVAAKQSFTNDAVGYERLIRRLRQAGQRSQILIAMEASGHYWYSLHDFLQRHGYHVVVVNPIQTAQQAKKGIRKRKTDKIDARHIATLIKNGEHRPTIIPGEPAMTCRQLTRLRYSMVRQRARIKQLIHSRLHPVWPEFESFFADPLSITARALLHAAPTPEDLLAMEPHDLAQVLRKASHGRLGAERAERIRAATETSIGMRRGMDGTRISIGTLLDQLDALRPVEQDLQDQIERLAAQLPTYLLTLPGTNAIRAVSLFGETDPVESFRSAEQLIAFAGLDIDVFQTGQYTAPRRHVTKRGSPFLRRTLWAMAAIAIRTEGELRSYYLRRKRAGLHYLAAVTATAIKLTRITWRILTDRRDYVPDGRSIQS